MVHVVTTKNHIKINTNMTVTEIQDPKLMKIFLDRLSKLKSIIIHLMILGTLEQQVLPQALQFILKYKTLIISIIRKDRTQ